MRSIGRCWRQCCRGIASHSSAGKKAASRNAVSIEAGNLEFAKRNDLIQSHLHTYYPSVSVVGQYKEYLPTSISDFITTYKNNNNNNESDKTKLCVIDGRIRSIRRSGKNIGFIDLYSAQDKCQLQVIVNYEQIALNNKVTEQSFQKTLQFLKSGDYVQVYGYPGLAQSRQKTFSLHSTMLPLVLAPAQLPLPPKLNDPAKIKANRAVDYQVNGLGSILLRAQLIKAIREFLDNRRYIEVETPILSSKSNGALAEAFVTQAKALQTSSKNLQLRVAPELWLKRLVVSGLDRVYEIGKVFRNEGIDSTHNPEFSTLEFYQSFASMEELISIAEDMIKFILLRLHKISSHLDGTLEIVPEMINVLTQNNWKFNRVEFLPTLAKELNLPHSIWTEDLLNSPHDLLQCVPENDRRLLFEVKNKEDVGTTVLSPQRILNKLCSHYIEKKYCTSLLPTLVYHHPLAMSPLAKTNPANALVAKRFELFIQGSEYINAYEEENCPQWQLAKFREQQQVNHTYGDKESLSVDEEYVNTLKWGMPPTGGLGLGIDRLCMLLLGKNRIEEVLPFGTIDDVSKQ